MAQRPWQVLRERFVTLDEADEFTTKSIKELTTSDAGRKSPCPPHRLDTLRLFQSNLHQAISDKRIRRTLEGLAKTQSGSQPYIKSEKDARPKPTQWLFKKLVVRGLAQLLPLYLANAEFGTKLFLSNFLMSFVPEFEGVWVTYRKVRSTDSRAFSYDAEALGVLVFNIDLEVLVFAPKPGQVLTAEVTEIRPEGMELALLGCWRASIAPDRLLDGSLIEPFDKKSNDDDNDMSNLVVKYTDPLRPKSDAVVMQRGSAVKFAIRRIRCTASSEGSESFSIEGSMKPVKLKSIKR